MASRPAVSGIAAKLSFNLDPKELTGSRGRKEVLGILFVGGGGEAWICTAKDKWQSKEKFFPY